MSLDQGHVFLCHLSRNKEKGTTKPALLSILIVSLLKKIKPG
jgi:hypothetical protein